MTIDGSVPALSLKDIPVAFQDGTQTILAISDQRPTEPLDRLFRRHNLLFQMDEETRRCVVRPIYMDLEEVYPLTL